MNSRCGLSISSRCFIRQLFSENPLSETVPEHLHDAGGFPHRVEMDGGNAVLQEVAALVRAPLRPDLPDGLRVGFRFPDGFRQRQRDVDGERFRKELHLARGREGLESGNDRNGDPGRAATVPEAVEDGIVKEPLGEEAIRSGIDLPFQECDVGLGIGRFEMLFRIAADTDAETPAAVHPANAPDEFIRVGIPAGNRCETLFARKGIPAQGHQVVDAEEAEILHQPFDLRRRIPGADQVRNDLHVVPPPDAGANGHRGDPAPDDTPFKAAVLLRNELDFIPMRRYIDKTRAEFHQRGDAFQQLILGHPAHGRNNLEGRERMAGIQQVGDSHNRWDRNARASSGEKPRAVV